MFWSASGAVALGVTLILTAGIIQVRRLRTRACRPAVPNPADLPEPVAKVADIPLGGEMKEDSRKSPTGPGSRAEEQKDQESRLLLARLRHAVDRLEEFQRIRRDMPRKSAESSLKGCHGGVDYLFRTGTG